MSFDLGQSNQYQLCCYSLCSNNLLTLKICKIVHYFWPVRRTKIVCFLRVARCLRLILQIVTRSLYHKRGTHLWNTRSWQNLLIMWFSKVDYIDTCAFPPQYFYQKNPNAVFNLNNLSINMQTIPRSFL